MEETVLKHIMTNNVYFDKVFSKMDKTLFNDPSNELIFETIQKHVVDYNNKPSLKEVAIAIKESNKVNKNLKEPTLEKFKGIAQDASVDNIDFLLDQTLLWVQRQRLTSAVFESADIIQADGEFAPIVSMFEDALDISFDTSVGLDYTNTISERLEYYHSKEAYTPLGLSNLDKALGGGIRPGSLFLFMGPTHSGKCHHYSENINIYVTDEELEKIKKSGVKYEYQEVYEE